VAVGAERHHVLSAKVLLLVPGDDVVVLDNRVAALAAAEVGLVPQELRDVGGRRRSVLHGSRFDGDRLTVL